MQNHPEVEEKLANAILEKFGRLRIASADSELGDVSMRDVMK